ncbi:glycoside hydrolase family 13 protein [Spirochaeta dissipatitropha]
MSFLHTIWAQSIRSEVNSEFVVPELPRIGENVQIKVRCLPGAEISGVGCRLHIDGHEKFLPMRFLESRFGFDYYALELQLQQKQLSYSFVFQIGDQCVFHTRRGNTLYHQNDDYNFVLLTDTCLPAWVRSSVFYQILPDRFSQGEPGWAVRTGEFDFHGFTSLKAEWHEAPREYEDAGCLDFYGGDLKGIEQKLDYLQELGVNALYLNPVFTAKTNHRYDCTDYFNVDPHLGGNQALANLIRTAHTRGFRIIIDVSINHTGSDHVWMIKGDENPDSQEYSYYYRNEQGNTIGWEGVSDLPQLNHSNPDVQQVFYGAENSLVRHYLKEPFGIDGWRFDVAGHTGNYAKDYRCHEVWQQVRKQVKDVNPDAYILGEHWEDSLDFLRGDEWDGVMNYLGSGRPLRRFLGFADRFMMVDSAPDHMLKPLDAGDVWEQMKQVFFRIPNQMMWQQYNLLDSHDIWRVHNHPHAPSLSLYAGIIAAMYMLPGTFSIYYGDEQEIPGWLSTTEGCRYPMQWDAARTDNARYQVFQRLNKLKREEPLLHEGALTCLYADGGLLVLCRFFENRALVHVLNRCTSRQNLRIPVQHLGFNDTSKISPVVLADEFNQQPECSIVSGHIDLELAAEQQFLAYVIADSVCSRG